MAKFKAEVRGDRRGREELQALVGDPNIRFMERKYWLVKTHAGDLAIVDPETFAKTYEKA